MHKFTADEDQLYHLIEDFQAAAFPLTLKKVCHLAHQYAMRNGIEGFSKTTNSAGRKWARGFLSRYQNLTTKKAKNLSRQRAICAHPMAIETWFGYYQSQLKKLGITDPKYIWNGDETGVQNVPREVRVVGVKGVPTWQMVSSEQGQTTTILTFVSGAGSVCPPMVIHKGSRIQTCWKNVNKPVGVDVVCSDRGYITKERFSEYGVTFIQHLKKNNLLGSPHLLIFDSHPSHVYNLDFLELMLANKVTVLTIPAHTSHIVQPLDHSPFAQFKQNWEKELRDYNFHHCGGSLGKTDFWSVFVPAWNAAMTPKTIAHGFEHTGIYPPNVQAIKKSKMAPSSVSEITCKNSDTYCSVDFFFTLDKYHLFGPLRFCWHHSLHYLHMPNIDLVQIMF